MAAPAGMVQDHNLRGMAVASISWVTCTVEANLVLLRMYVRIKTAYDQLRCFSKLLAHAHTTHFRTILTRSRHFLFRAQSLTLIKVANRAGRQINALTPAQFLDSIKCTIVEGVELVIGTCFGKVSVCTFFLRFIDRIRQAARYLIFVIMAFLITSTLGLVIALLAQCRL